MPNELQVQALLTSLSVQRSERHASFSQAWQEAQEQGLVVDGLGEARAILRWEYEHPKIPTQFALAGTGDGLTHGD